MQICYFIYHNYCNINIDIKQLKNIQKNEQRVCENMHIYLKH